MISSREALEIVIAHRCSMQTETVSLSGAVGRILAEDVHADRDFPPFDRVTMDGIGIAYHAFRSGQRRFRILGIAAAGSPRCTLQDESACYEVMTGAIMPISVDTVIRYEDIVIEDGYAVINEEVVEGQNVHRRASDGCKGDQLLSAGVMLNAVHINILATVGKSVVSVQKRMSAAIIATGNELVPVEEQPAIHQIRLSNAHMLAARLSQMDVDARLYHLVDDRALLKDQLGAIIERYDVILMSGGVSKGKYDFVPEVLDELQVVKHFHRVAQRPGKPMWFGTREGKAIFALPGNPVSTLACFHRYFVPWYQHSMDAEVPSMTVILDNEVAFSPALTYFAQARVVVSEGKIRATISHGRGSGDLVHPSTMDGFVVLPADRSIFYPDEVFEFLPFRPIL